MTDASELRRALISFENGRWQTDKDGLLLYLLEMQERLLSGTSHQNTVDLMENVINERSSLAEELHTMHLHCEVLDADLVIKARQYKDVESKLVGLQSALYDLTKEVGDIIKFVREVHDGER